MNNLPKVVTQQRRGRPSNPRLLDRKSDALPLSHRVTPKQCSSIHIVHVNQSSSSRMRVMNDNCSATKQRLHPQSVAEISRHSVLSRDSI